MNDKKEIRFGFGLSEERCEAESFATIKELLEYAQQSWDEKDGNPFDVDCDDSGCIHVGTYESFTAADFAPSLDDIADQMTDRFYCDHNINDDADVQVSHRKEAEAEFKAFIEKYFDIPCTCSCQWNIGIYDLTTHEWVERYPAFNDYVKEGEI